MTQLTNSQEKDSSMLIASNSSVDLKQSPDTNNHGIKSSILNEKAQDFSDEIANRSSVEQTHDINTMSYEELTELSRQRTKERTSKQGQENWQRELNRITETFRPLNEKYWKERGMEI